MTNITTNNNSNNTDLDLDKVIKNPSANTFKNKVSPNDTVVIWQYPIYIPSMAAIQSKYLTSKDNTPFPVIHNSEGSFNKVIIYRTDNGKKIAYREAKEYFKYNDKLNPNLLSPRQNNDEMNERLLELNESAYNIVTSSKYKISPKLYYYGLMNIYNHDNNDVIQKIIQISEAYDMDLKNYLNTKENYEKTTLSEEDIHIRDQIITLLQTMTKKMEMICYDIKPPNSVINVDTKEVRLIDWDADWCIAYNNLLRKDSNRKMIDLLNIILMANHLYTYSNFNIFYTYIQEQVKEDDTELIESLKQHFCDRLDGYDNYYQTITRHYFNFNEKQFPNCKEDIFTELLKRARNLRKDTTIGGKKQRRQIKHRDTKKNIYSRKTVKSKRISKKPTESKKAKKSTKTKTKRKDKKTIRDHRKSVRK